MAEVNPHAYPMLILATIGFWTPIFMWKYTGYPEPGLLWPLLIMAGTMGLPALYLLYVQRGWNDGSR